MNIDQQPKKDSENLKTHKGSKGLKTKKGTKDIKLEEEQKINLNVKTLNGQNFLLNVSTNDNIFELKKKIHDIKKMSNDDTINDVKIIFKGKQLTNESTVGTNNLKENDDIVIFTIYKNNDIKNNDNMLNMIASIQHIQNITPIQTDSLQNILSELNNLQVNDEDDDDDDDDDEDDDNDGREYDDDFSNLTYKPIPEEQNDIRELMSLGFQESLVVQIYICCNKNKDLAASMLFSS